MKEKIIKYITGTASAQEEKEVITWIGLSEENRRYFLGMKNLWVRTHLPAEKATAADFDAFVADKPYMGYTQPRAKSAQWKTWMRYGVAAAIALGLILNAMIGMGVIGRQSENEGALSATTEMPAMAETTGQMAFYTNKGVKGYVMLPDSSEVWLNADSRISYPAHFMAATREVVFEGEGYFKIKSHPECPMVVRTGKGFDVKVTGTEFNLRCYANDQESKASLYKGSITLLASAKTGGATRVLRVMQPNESYVINHGTAVKETKRSPQKEAVWKEGVLEFESEPMMEVIKKLERWHGATFIVKDPEVLNYRLNARFKEESLVQVMELIKLCTPISYRINGTEVELRLP